MSHYLSFNFSDTPDFVRTFDETPLWSAAFGAMLLQHVELARGMRVLDVGSGTGFPLLELAERLGSGSVCVGLDPWLNASARAREKAISYGIEHVSFVDGSGDNMPFPDASFDLIVSNLGINNFENPEKVAHECNRVLCPGGRISITTNTIGHWREFYQIFETVLENLGKDETLGALKQEQDHRGTRKEIAALLINSGFTIRKLIEDRMKMKFLDGSAFLNHHFVKLGWLQVWKNMFLESERKEVFAALEHALNRYATRHKGLALTVPMLYVEAVK